MDIRATATSLLRPEHISCLSLYPFIPVESLSLDTVMFITLEHTAQKQNLLLTTVLTEEKKVPASVTSASTL